MFGTGEGPMIQPRQIKLSQRRIVDYWHCDAPWLLIFVALDFELLVAVLLQKAEHGVIERLGPFDITQVARAFNDRQARSRNPPRHFARGRGRREGVLS